MRYEQTPIWSPRDGEDASRSPPRARPGKMLEEKDESAKLQSVYWAAHRMRSWGTQPRASDSLQSEEGINKIRQVAQVCFDPFIECLQKMNDVLLTRVSAHTGDMQG
eukprot:2773404-Rhodomonas_salina.1